MRTFWRYCRELALYGLLFACLFGGWLYWAFSSFRSAEPAGPTLADHLDNRPPPWKSFAITNEGQEYLILHGPMPPVLRFPSGEPVYVFDSTGQFVDWTADIGDASDRFLRRWKRGHAKRELTPEEVEAWPGSGR